MTLKQMGLLALCVSMLSGVAVAGSRDKGGHEGRHHGGNPTKHMERIAHKLDFSGEQIGALDRILAEFSVQLKPLHRELKTTRRSLFRAEPFNDGEVAEVSARSGDLTRQMSAMRMQLHNDFLALMTAEQRLKLGEFIARHSGRH